MIRNPFSKSVNQSGSKEQENTEVMKKIILLPFVAVFAV